MTSIGGERKAVQNRIIRYAEDVGWIYVGPEEALRLRGGKSGLMFRDLFRDQMGRLNPGFMTEDLSEELMGRLQRLFPTVEGNLAAWEYLKGLGTVFVPGEDRERNVTLLDTDDIENNVFSVTDEFMYTNGTNTIRPDIVFLINGVPVLFVETKAAHLIEGMSQALQQVKRYQRQCPEIFSLLQVYAITHIINYYYSVTWNTSTNYLFDWKEEAEGDFESLVKSFLDRSRVVRLVTDWILFTRQDDELRKVVLRPHQMRAVDKVLERAGEEKKRGLVWHTQGSGKTYSMIVAAKKIMENPLLQNPTVILLVDRNELETQLFGNLRSVGVKQIEVARSKKHLRQLLANDRRGLIVTMIHKFDGMPEDINTRENIFVLVDEAHRTTGGKLGNYLTGALPDATYIGFTGTPIDKTLYGKGTFITFGLDDAPQGYLDKYSIAQSIEDGTTVPLNYTLAPNNLLVDRDTLEEDFLNLAEARGISDVEKLNKVLEKAVTLRNMLKNTTRIDRVAEFLARHYRENVDPMGYKAFVVAVDREACALCKDALDRYLPENYSRVVYSAGHNDPPELSRYHLSGEEEKRIRRDFRNPDELPKILIVTEKLLTGFDAPVLYAMYLDKPMRDHVLLQAIARVNRPYEDKEGGKKPSGFVLDFVGIFSNLEKALAFDSHDIEGIVEDIALLKDRFTEMMGQASTRYLSLLKGRTPDKAVEVVLEEFRDEEKRGEFYSFFKEASDIYEIISPDAFLRPYVEDYDTLARMFRILREAYEPHLIIDRDFSKKTAQLVREHTHVGKIRPALHIYEINQETLRQLQESKASETEKVFNLIKSINRAVADKKGTSPYLISVGERAELIAKMFKERQLSTQKALEELKELIDEINQAAREQAHRNLSPEAFSVYWVFKQEDIPDLEDRVKDVEDALEQYPHWRTSEHHERGVKQELYKTLLKGTDRKPSDVAKIAQQTMRILKA